LNAPDFASKIDFAKLAFYLLSLPSKTGSFYLLDGERRLFYPIRNHMSQTAAFCGD
jgi:hypothetical protein